MEDNESPLLTLCNQAVKLEQPRERDTLRHSPSARTSISLPLGLSSSRSAFSVKAKRKSDGSPVEDTASVASATVSTPISAVTSPAPPLPGGAVSVNPKPPPSLAVLAPGQSPTAVLLSENGSATHTATPLPPTASLVMAAAAAPSSGVLTPNSSSSPVLGLLSKKSSKFYLSPSVAGDDDLSEDSSATDWQLKVRKGSAGEDALVQRRKKHNEVEVRRRKRMNETFTMLRTLVDCRSSNKIAILVSAIQKIEYLHLLQKRGLILASGDMPPQRALSPAVASSATSAAPLSSAVPSNSVSASVGAPTSHPQPVYAALSHPSPGYHSPSIPATNSLHALVCSPFDSLPSSRINSPLSLSLRRQPPIAIVSASVVPSPPAPISYSSWNQQSNSPSLNYNFKSASFGGELPLLGRSSHTVMTPASTRFGALSSFPMFDQVTAAAESSLVNARVPPPPPPPPPLSVACNLQSALMPALGVIPASTVAAPATSAVTSLSSTASILSPMSSPALPFAAETSTATAAGSSNAAAANGAESKQNLCLLCFAHERNSMFLPCGHMSYCSSCVEHLGTSLRGCSKCSSPVTKVVRLQTESKDSTSLGIGTAKCIVCDDVRNVALDPCGHFLFCAQCTSRARRCPHCLTVIQRRMVVSDS